MDATGATETRTGPKHLLDAVLAVSSDLDLPTVLRRVVAAAADLSAATYGALGVLDERREVLAEFVTVGVDDELRDRIGEFPRGHGILGTLIRDPRPLRLPDLAEHPDSFGFPPHHPRMKSFLGVPILIQGQAYGNLYLCDKVGGESFTALDEDLVVALAGAAAIAIDNARMHARVAEVALLEERDRIARDLHDTVIQRLFAVGLNLQGAIRMSKDSALIERIEQAVDGLDATVRELRSAIFELHTSHLVGQSTRQAVSDVCAEASRALGFEPSVLVDGPIDTAVDSSTAEHLAAVLREALSNVAKHASAHDARVWIRVGGDTLYLRVQDDGVGIDSPDRGGRGLDNIRQRAQRLGGSTLLSAVDGGGTRLEWTVPLR